jgi:AAA domain
MGAPMEEFKIERAKRTQARLRLAVTASSNGGKTWSSILIAKGIVEHMIEQGILTGTLEGKIGVIDTERKSSTLYEHLAPFDCVHLNPPYSADRYGQALTVLEGAGYPVIIVDQISHAWSGPGGMLAMLNRVAKSDHYGNTFNAWGDITPAQDAFIDRLLSSPAHLIVTMRQKTEWVLEAKVGRDGKEKLQPRRIGTKPIQRDGVEYEFTTLLGLDTDTHLATTLKNRCPVFKDGVQVLLNEDVGKRLAEWMLGGAPLAAEEARQPTDEEQAIGIVEAAEGYLPACKTLPDLARRFEAALAQLRGYKPKIDNKVGLALIDRLVAAKDKQKGALQARGAIVKDLVPEDVAKPAAAPPPTALDLARASCEKIGNSRPGGFFSDMEDDLPF